MWMKDTVEEKFDVLETGTYELIIYSSDDEGIYVTGAIGPLPDESKKIHHLYNFHVDTHYRHGRINSSWDI